MTLKFLLAIFCFFSYNICFCAQDVSSGKLRTLYNSLDPTSISQHLAFYDLYSNTHEGQQALKEAYRLLTGSSNNISVPLNLPPYLATSIQTIVGLVNKNPNDTNLKLSEAELSVIDKLASRLHNRHLPGYYAISEEKVLQLPSEQIDLARGVLLSQLGNNLIKVRSYEAIIDLMALQILTQVSLNASPKAKIRAISRFIFEEMGFRFPPQSSLAKEVDLYTFLPSVLDSRKGVCLGVSILYLCLAQRLNLDLEIITPPGHIYVRWRNGDEIINIETTARGIHLPSEEYLGIDTRSLQQRNIKETIGTIHVNQASVYWQDEQYDKALECYVKAQRFLPDDMLVAELMGYLTLIKGDEENGKKLMQQVVDFLPDYAVSKDTIAEDYLNGIVKSDGIKAVFTRVDETRKSLLHKKQVLEESLKKYPRFREGIFSLAGTWLQLHRSAEALNTLLRYHEIDPTNATVEYYLAALHAERIDYNNAWKHLKIAEELVHNRQHDPHALHDFRQSLAEHCPE